MRGEGSGLVAMGVTLRIGRKVLLDRVDATVPPGRMLAIIGPNGAGKSTLMRVLAGELAPDAGEVRLDGRLLSQIPRRSLARRRGFLRQRFAVTSPFSVEQVVRLGRAPYASSGLSELDGVVARRLLAEVGLGGFETRDYATLSGGEQQRVHLARVLAQLELGEDMGAAVLLLDEPSSSLDPRHQHETLALARRRARAGLAVAAVLHDIALAMHYADDVLLMKHGAVVAHEPAAEIHRDTVSAVFGLRAVTWIDEDGSSRWALEP
ncbi:MAG: heme ABC transporter ATP-binding protein [Myxococcales bacterium]|nr:heme ABC transporter ATP-binding protein [Myxococcales bacterium]